MPAWAGLAVNITFGSGVCIIVIGHHTTQRATFPASCGGGVLMQDLFTSMYIIIIGLLTSMYNLVLTHMQNEILYLILIVLVTFSIRFVSLYVTCTRAFDRRFQENTTQK